jgi:hydroxypyruvate isomerase
VKASVCIEMIFADLPFLDRIKQAAAVGYDAVEFWNWDNKDLPAIKQTAAEAGIEVLTFQSNRGGTLINPEQRESFVAGIQESLGKANEMGVRNLFLLTDELGDDRSVVYQFPDLGEEAKRQSVLDGLKAIAPLAEAAGVQLNLEPLNTLVDHKGYWLNHAAPGFELVREVNSPNIRLLFDIYHMQVMEGNLIETMRANLDAIGHVHVADVPGRHEPGTGEINYQRVLSALRDAGYQGYVGMEFDPTGASEKAAADALALVKG